MARLFVILANQSPLVLYTPWAEADNLTITFAGFHKNKFEFSFLLQT